MELSAAINRAKEVMEGKMPEVVTAFAGLLAAGDAPPSKEQLGTIVDAIDDDPDHTRDFKIERTNAWVRLLQPRAGPVLEALNGNQPREIVHHKLWRLMCYIYVKGTEYVKNEKEAPGPREPKREDTKKAE